MAQVEMQEWWRRHKDLDLGGYTKEEIEDLTGCVPLLLSKVSEGGTKVEVKVPMLAEVAQQAQQFVHVKWKELRNNPMKWDR